MNDKDNISDFDVYRIHFLMKECVAKRLSKEVFIKKYKEMMHSSTRVFNVEKLASLYEKNR